ncbi:MAG: LysM peptidoglycan-binding domain-containing protein [Phycisphaerae bacterium]
MNRETKVGLITGLAIIVMVGMLLSSYLNRQSSSIKVASLSNLGSKLRQTLLHPISDQTIPMPKVSPAGVQAAPAGAAASTASLSGATPAAYTPSSASGTATVVSMPGYTSTPLVTFPTAPSPHLAPVSQNTNLQIQNAEQTQTTSPKGDTTYTVAANDTLTRIAWHFYHDSGPVAIERIVRANPGKLTSPSSMLRIGEKLDIPPAAGRVTMPSLMAVSTGTGRSSTTKSTRTCVVRPGDTLYQIALRTMGAATAKNINAIKQANGITNARDLRVGEKLHIP